MNLTEKVITPTHVMARQVDDETVILDLEGGAYFGLDAIGTRVWQLLNAGKTLAEVCDVMVGEFEVERADLERDVLALVSELDSNQLISRA